MKDLKRLQSFLSLKGEIVYENFLKNTAIRNPNTGNNKTKEAEENEKKNIMRNENRNKWNSNFHLLSKAWFVL